jgi:methylglyoxal/glyoxal reductase
MTLTVKSAVTLNNGVEMPRLGLGVYQAGPGKEAQQAVLWALEAGYRHIDTAKLYGNEADVGIAVRQSGLSREEVFITTKLWNSDHGYDRAIAAFHKSQQKLGLQYIDLYLIHWPVSSLRYESWQALETLLEEGKCRAIGVSNYTIQHLEELLAKANVMPAINQVEFSPYLYQKELLDYCNAHGIQLEAYSPLTKGRQLQDPKLVAIAQKYSKSTAQILIRWALQHDLVVIPKSSKRAHIYDNADVFDFNISQEDMDQLDTFDVNLHTSWDPTAIA